MACVCDVGVACVCDAAVACVWYVGFAMYGLCMAVYGWPLHMPPCMGGMCRSHPFVAPCMGGMCIGCRGATYECRGGMYDV